MILVGTFHTDLEGPHRLELLLNYFKPRVVTLESPASIPVEEAVRKILTVRELMTKVARSLNLPQFLTDWFCDSASGTGYEIVVPAVYARSTGAQLYSVDHPQVSFDSDIFSDETAVAAVLKDAANLFISELEKREGSIDSLSGISYVEARPKICQIQDEVYRTGRIEAPESLEALLRKQLGETASQLLDPAFAEKREQFMTTQLLHTLPDMHIGGLRHTHPLAEKGMTVPLYERLGNAVLQAVKLCDAEALVKAAQ